MTKKKFINLPMQTFKARKQFKRHMIGYITAAFGLVAALAWNDAISSLINHFFSTEKSSIGAKFIYAAVITLVVVIISFYLAKLTKEENREN